MHHCSKRVEQEHKDGEYCQHKGNLYVLVCRRPVSKDAKGVYRFQCNLDYTIHVGVVHTAFDDPAIDGAGVPRRSVELRTVALWD